MYVGRVVVSCCCCCINVPEEIHPIRDKGGELRLVDICRKGGGELRLVDVCRKGWW